MASLRDFELGKKEDERPSTAPPRLVETIAPPATPPPEAALRPSTAMGQQGQQNSMQLTRPVSISDAASGLHAWLRVYARTVNFSNLPLTPQGAMMAQHLKPMPPKNVTGFVSQPPLMPALEAFVAAVAAWVQRQERPSSSSQAALPKVDLAALAAEGKEKDVKLTNLKKPKNQDDKDFFFEDQKPKLPYVKALPSKVDQLSRPFPTELEERWKGGTLNQDVFELAREEEARRKGENFERPDTPIEMLMEDDEPDLEEDVYQVDTLTAFQVYASLLKNPQMPLVWEDVHFAAAEFGVLRTAKQRSDDFTEDMKINLTEMSLIAPNGPRSSHWELACKQLNAGERQQLEAAYVERLKPVYEQLGGDIEHPEAACVDFRLFVVVLIGLAKFQDKPKLTTMVGEKPEQEQARRRLTMAIRVLCPNDGKDEAQGKGKKKKVPNGRRLTEDELFIVILAMHLIFIENSHKLHELVRKKVDIMLSNAAADSDYAESLSTTHFPRLAVHGVAATNLVFPTVHEIAALNLENFPNCFHTPKGQELLNRLPRKAKYVSCPPGSVEFLAQEMPDDIPNEDPRGDGSPLLNAVEKEHFKGSDFFDPDVVLDRFLKEVKRAVDIRKIRYDKRKEEEKQAALEKDSEPAEPEKPLVTEWHTAGAEMPAGILDTDADWAVPAAAAPELDVPIKTDEGEIADAELDLPAEPVLPVPERNSDVPVKTEQGEIDDAELGLPPEPVLPTPDWNSDPAKTTQGEISDVELSLPPEPILPAPEWNSDVPVKTDQGEIDDAKLGLPPEPVLPTPEWNRDVPVRKGRGLPQGGALMNLSDEDFDIPPPPQLLSPPARPKTGSDVPRLPLVMQHAHEPQALLPEVHANAPHDLDDPRYWTYERYQREKSRARMCSSCCSCETFKESQCKLVLLALLLVALSVLALGMSGSLKDRLMIEATYALSGVFFFLGCISCCKACCVTQSAEAVESQLNHPDAMIGRPLIGDYSESSELPV